MRYVQLRRLEHAAAALAGDQKVIDIALAHGFETHSGFSKAFRRRFGCSPETYRRHAHFALPTLPVLKHPHTTGGIIMQPKFVTLPEIQLAGYVLHTTDQNGQNNIEIPAFWTDYLRDGRAKKLHRESFIKSHDEYGVCFPADASTGQFEYMIGLEPKEGAVVPAGYQQRSLPAATYAVFSTPPSAPAEVSSNVQGVWNYIFSEWFPTSGYEYADGCVDFELYPDESAGQEQDNVCEVYIPVTKKDK